MRQFVSGRWWMTILVLVGATIVIALVVGTPGGGDTKDAVTPMRRRLDLIGVPDAVRADEGWRVRGGATDGRAQFTLDGHTYLLEPGTLGDVDCDPTEQTCLVLADRLGDAIVWFTFIDADVASGEVALPPIEETLDGVTWARLVNGWELPLLSVVQRRCPDETTSFLDFLERFGTNHIVYLDLEQREISAVECVIAPE